MTAVTLRNLSVVYPNTTALVLDNFNLEIPSGKLTIVLGPSGCGKSTLMKLIGGLLEPSKGDILFDDVSVLPIPPEKRDAVMVFQNYLLFPHLNVFENICFGLRMRALGDATIAERVAQAMEMIQLSGLEQRMPSQLSGGQQQRVALARALVVQPRVLLLDEPLSNLDAHLRLEMRDLIKQIQRNTAVTCVFVTHDQQEAVVLADSIALLLDHQLQQFGAPADFFEQPANLAVARFFGAQNFVRGKQQNGSFVCALGTFTVPENTVATADIAVFRPETLQLTPQPAATSKIATVTSVAYHGSSSQLQVQLADGAGNDGQKLIIDCAADTFRHVSVGGQVNVLADPAKCWLVSE